MIDLDKLSTDIMNLPCERTMSHFASRDAMLHYKEGHRAARRATPSSDCALPPLLDKVADIIELYAESYDTMARMNGGNNKVGCTCVAVDLRQNISKQVCAAIAEQVERIRREAVEADRRARDNADK